MTCFMFDKILDDFKVAVEAGSAQRRRIGLGRAVNRGTATHQIANDGGVTGRRRHPQRWCAFNRLPVERHCNTATNSHY